MLESNCILRIAQIVLCIIQSYSGQWQWYIYYFVMVVYIVTKVNCSVHRYSS